MVWCALLHREPTGEPEVEAADVVTGTEREGAVGAGKLLPVQPHLREGHQCLDDCGLDTEGGQRDRAVQGRNRLLQQQDRLCQGRNRQVEPPQGDSRGTQQVGQGLGPGQGRATEQGPNKTADRDPCGAGGLRTGPPVVLMPLQGPGGMVGAVLGELRVTIASNAEAWDRCTMEERQQLWNETDGDDCACGTWDQYGTHDGGWAAVATVAGVHGCQNTAAGDSDFCLYYSETPDQPCDQWGRILFSSHWEAWQAPQNQHIHPERGHMMLHPAPARCGEVWPGMHCPLCRYTNGHNCFRRCGCPCDGCAVGRVWYTPDHAELDTYEPPDTPYDDQDDMVEQARDMDDEWLAHHDILQDQDNFDPAAGEGEAGGPSEDAVAPAGTAQDAAPAASAVVEAAVDTAEAAMDAAPAASATGAEAGAAEPEDLGTAELASQGRLICAAATAALKETVDTRDFNKDGQYSPETPSGTYSPVTLSYSSDAAMPVQQDQYVRAAAVDATGAAMVAVSAGPTAADAATDAAGEDAARGRTGARVCKPGCRAGSAWCRQQTGCQQGTKEETDTE